MNREKHLIDSFNREISYLRLSVTDRCNLRCTYCMSENMTFLSRKQILSFEEMLSVAKAFVELGVRKIRLTGGEPLVRNGVVSLAKSIYELNGLEELVLTTNGVLLDEYAKPLVDAGVSRINISLDSLRADRFKEMTRMGELEQVLQGIKVAKTAGFKRIKLNSVILHGINDDEVVNLAQFAINNDMDISFIEEMPLGEIDSHLREETQMLSQRIQNSLVERFDLIQTVNNDKHAGPSRYHQIAGTDTRVGFISPISNNFCASCNRVRVTTEGQLLLCLGNENAVDLKQIGRDNDWDVSVLKQAIIGAMENKPEKHYFNPKEIKIRRHMSVTGG